MRLAFLEKIRCPICKQEFLLPAENFEQNWLQEGRLVCPSGHEYPIRNGIPCLYTDDHGWQSKAREAQGWVDIHKEKGIYEVETDPVDLKVPYFPEEPWIEVAKSFDIALDILKLSGTERVLDLGAGRGWAAKQFALRGCEVAALDIVEDVNVGLGRAYALMQDAGIEFDLVIADGEKLPFAPGIFDIVFCSAVLHHSSDLPAFLKNIATVLKPGGKLCAIFEPCIPLWASEKSALKKHSQEELQFGINETRPNFNQYLDALEEAGLKVERVFPSETYGMSDEQLSQWAQQKGVRLAWQPNLQESIIALGKYSWRRGRGLLSGAMTSSQRYVSPHERSNLQYDILKWSGGEMILLAAKLK